jgi:hypothetical protein
LTTNGMSDVHLRIVHEDFPAPSGNGTHGRGIGAFKWLGGSICFSRGGGVKLRTMPPANSALIVGTVYTSFVATIFLLCAMFVTNSALTGSFGASLVAAAVAFQLRAMPDTNSSLLDFICAPLVAAALYLRAMPDTNSGLVNGSIGASLVAATFPESHLIPVAWCWSTSLF